MTEISPFANERSLRLILVRHGEPELASNDTCLGKLDCGLSARGRSQIHAKLNSIRALGGNALFTSPIRRAAESAAIIADYLQLPIAVRPELQEIDFGRFDGLKYSQIERLYPQEYKFWMERPLEVKFPGGESFSEMKKRVLEFKNSMLSVHAAQSVLVISHSGTNRILLADALGVPSEFLFRIGQEYGAINVIDYFPAYECVRLMNG